jgi:hypothetical protein
VDDAVAREAARPVVAAVRPSPSARAPQRRAYPVQPLPALAPRLTPAPGKALETA